MKQNIFLYLVKQIYDVMLSLINKYNKIFNLMILMVIMQSN